MKAFDGSNGVEGGKKPAKPSEELRIAVTFKRPQDGLGPTKLGARLSSASVKSFSPEPFDVDKALAELSRRGFTTTQRGRLSATIRGSRGLYEKVFGTRLSAVPLSRKQSYSQTSVYFPAKGAPWKPEPAVASLIDDAYIQWPHIYMSPKAAAKPVAAKKKTTVPSATPPHVDYFHLEVPVDVAAQLNASAVHQAGTTGKGVRVAMIDSGFYHRHPYFKSHGYQSSVVLAPGAAHRRSDGNGHGTGESANVFSVAPGATFIGVKVDNEDDPQGGASVLEGFLEAMKHKPHVVSVSLGYDLRVTDPVTGDPTLQQLATLPNSLVALEAEIQAAVADGTVVVFSAGNGHYSFPGMMPEVISAGGVYVDENGDAQASDYASAFASRVYSGRHVPDFCGLVGMQPHADYIMLPIAPDCEIDVENSAHDETKRNDAWGVFSGTSAAAPQIAGVCALLLERNPGLTPADVKSVLSRTARDVDMGRANWASDESGNGLSAGPGRDSATGTGLVDAFAAWQQV